MAEAQEAAQPPLALVNGVPLYAFDLQCVLEASPIQGLLPKPSGSGGMDAQSHSANALGQLITIELLYQESLKHRYPGLTLEVEERYRKEVDKLGGEGRLQAALRCNDMTPETFRRAIFRNLSINRYLDDHVFSRIVIGEEEVRRYYESNLSRFSPPPSVRLRQILIRVPSWEDSQRVHAARTLADQVSAMASGGGDFESLVRRFSEDPSSAPSGGELGLVIQGDRRFPFEREAFSMAVGGVSRPLTSRQGFHILKVVDRTPPSARPLEEVRTLVVSMLRQEKAAAMVSALVTRLRSTADIHILHPQTR